MNKIKRYIRFNFMNCQKLKFSMAFFASGKKKGQLFIFIKANLVWKDDEGDVRSASGHTTISDLIVYGFFQVRSYFCPQCPQAGHPKSITAPYPHLTPSVSTRLSSPRVFKCIGRSENHYFLPFVIYSKKKKKISFEKLIRSVMVFDIFFLLFYNLSCTRYFLIDFKFFAEKIIQR